MFKKFNPCGLRKPVTIKHNNNILPSYNKNNLSSSNNQKTNSQIIKGENKGEVELIIASINLNKYNFANEKIKKFFNENLQSNSIKAGVYDIMTTIFCGLNYIKNAKVSKYMLSLSKLNSLSKKETNSIVFDKTIKEFCIKLFMTFFQGTCLNSLFHSSITASNNKIPVVPKKNKSCESNDNNNNVLNGNNNNFQWNYHYLFQVFLMYGYIYMNKVQPPILNQSEKSEMISIIKNNITKEKCSTNNCDVCKKFNDLMKPSAQSPTSYLKSTIAGYDDIGNSLIKNEEVKKPFNIRINNNNCTSAKKLIGCPFTKKEKNRNNFLCSFQHYMSNTLNSHAIKKNSSNYESNKIKLECSNNNNTYTCTEVKTTSNSKTAGNCSLNNKNNANNKNKSNIASSTSLNYFSLKKQTTSPSSIKTLERSLGIIEAKLDSIQNDFIDFKNFNRNIKTEMNSIFSKSKMEEEYTNSALGDKDK